MSLCSLAAKATVHAIVTVSICPGRSPDTSAFYGRRMSVIAWIRALGNDGAVSNARQLADQRAVEEWAVAVVARRLDDVGSVRDRPASAA
jgi:hypothetical protein